MTLHDPPSFLFEVVDLYVGCLAAGEAARSSTAAAAWGQLGRRGHDSKSRFACEACGSEQCYVCVPDPGRRCCGCGSVHCGACWTVRGDTCVACLRSWCDACAHAEMRACDCGSAEGLEVHSKCADCAGGWDRRRCGLRAHSLVSRPLAQELHRALLVRLRQGAAASQFLELDLVFYSVDGELDRLFDDVLRRFDALE